MLKITILVDATGGQAIGIKEALAMDLEKYGDTKVIAIEEVETQMQMEEGGWKCLSKEAQKTGKRYM